MSQLQDIGEALLVVPDKNLSYSNIEHFKERVMESAAVVSNVDIIAIDGSFIHFVDSTAIKVIACVILIFRSNN